MTGLLPTRITPCLTYIKKRLFKSRSMKKTRDLSFNFVGKISPLLLNLDTKNSTHCYNTVVEYIIKKAFYLVSKSYRKSNFLPIDFAISIPEDDFCHAIFRFASSIPDEIFASYYQAIDSLQMRYLSQNQLPNIRTINRFHIKS